MEKIKNVHYFKILVENNLEPTLKYNLMKKNKQFLHGVHGL
jgi:hypothetical protein